MKRYILEKSFDGEWYFEGNYSESFFPALVARIFLLGRYGGVYEDVRVRIEEDREE